MANEFKIKKGLIVTGASGGTVVDIQGSQGQLFSVTDDLSGSIFAVSDISGVPILDVNSSGLVTVDGPFTQTGGGATTLSGTLNVDGEVIIGSGEYLSWGTSGATAIEGSTVSDKMRFYTDSILALTLDASQDATFAGQVTAGEYNLPSGGMLDWANGDARIVEGLVNNYSLSFQTWDGSNLNTALRLDGNNDATFATQAFATTATSSGDGSSTLTTKGYVDGLITGATIYRGAWQAGISATSSAATTASTTLTVTAAILDADGNTPVLVGAVVTGAGITGIVKVASVTSSTVYVLDTAITATATAYIFSPIYGAPDLSGVTETSGYYYICSEAGSATPNGANSEPNTWAVGDWCIYNDVSGTGQWQKIDNSSVLSGAGTGQTVALWEGPSSVTDSETLGNAPITVSGNDTTFAGMITVNGGGIDIDNDDDIRLRFDNASAFKAGLQVATTAGDMIAGSAIDDFAIRAQENMLFSSGGNAEVLRLDTSGNATFAGNVTLTSGVLSISGDGSNAATLTESSAGILTIAAVDDIILDAEGDIALDANGGDIRLRDGGTTFGTFTKSGNNFHITSNREDGYIKFFGNDGGTSVTALTLNMADGGDATFAGNVTAADLLTVNGDGHLFLGATGETPKIDMLYTTNASGRGWDTRIFTGKTDDLPNAQSFPTSTIAGGYGTQYQANSDGAFFGIIPYATGHYRPIINWGDDVADTPFSFQFNGSDIVTINYVGGITAPSFSGDHIGTINTATTGFTQTAGNNSTLIATTAYADAAAAAVPIGNYLPLSAGSGYPLTGELFLQSDLTIDNATGDPYIKLKTVAQEYVVRIDQSDSEKFQIRDTTNSATRLTIDTSGNVGIGTTSPGVKMDVEGDSASAGDLLRLTNSNTGGDSKTSAMIYRLTDSAGTRKDAGYIRVQGINNNITTGASMEFWTRKGNSNPTESMRISTNGNVGINGTSNSAGDTNNGVPKLQVNTTTAALGEFPLAARFTTNSDAGDDSGVSVLINSGNDRGLMISAGREVGNVAKVTLNVVDNAGDEIDTITLLQNGSGGTTANVGIGTTSPDALLELSKDAAGAQGATLRLTNSVGGSGAGSAVEFVGPGTQPIHAKIITEDAGAFDSTLIFQTKATGTGGALADRLTINNVGNVGIGTDSPGTFLQIGDYPSNNIDITTYPDIPSEHMIHLTAPETTGRYGGGISFGENAFTAANITAQDAGGNGSLHMLFGTRHTSGIVEERMRIDSSGNVGIGTTNPGYTLEIAGPSTTSFAYQRTGVSANKWGFHSDNDATYWQNLTSGNLLFTLQNGGNVGIGVTGPAYKLDVDETTSGNLTVARFKHNQSAVTSNIILENAAGGDNSGFNVNFKTGSSGYGGALGVIRTNSPNAGDADMFLSSGGGEAIRILSNGNVGIGTSTPLAKLDIQGTQGQLFSVTDNLSGSIFAVADISGVPIFDVNSSGVSYFDGTVEIGTSTVATANAAADDLWLRSTGSNGITISSGNAQTGTIFFGDVANAAAAGFRYNHNTGDMAISAEDNITFACDNVGIGHTSPTGKLDIFRTSLTYAINRANTLDRAGLVIKSSGNFDSKITFSSGASSVQYIQALNNSATVGRDININPYGGNVITAGTMTATNFILSSDEKLKENIEKACDNRIKADWKTFELKTDKGQKRYGVIAQELEKTNPEFVREDTQGFKSVAYIDLLIAKIAELEARLEKAGI